MAGGSSLGPGAMLRGSGQIETWLFPLSAYQLLAADKSSSWE